jgi:hypothetical protein
MRPKRASASSPLAANTARQLNVLGHDSNPLAMDGAEIGLLKQPNKVRLCAFLKSHKSMVPKQEIRPEVLSNLTHQPLERGFEDEELSPLLILPDLTQGHSAWAEVERLLDPSSARSGLACSLGGQGLPRSLAASGLSRSLLRACHRWTEMYFPRFDFLIYTPKFPKIAKMVKSHAKSHAKSHTRTGTRRDSPKHEEPHEESHANRHAKRHTQTRRAAPKLEETHPASITARLTNLAFSHTVTLTVANKPTFKQPSHCSLSRSLHKLSDVVACEALYP